MSVPFDPKFLDQNTNIREISPPQGQIFENPLNIWKEGDPIPDISRPSNDVPPFIGPLK
jgi:hypothetical protein